MMLLEAGEVCKLSNNCPYHTGPSGPCHGTFAHRQNKFQCKYVINGQIVEGGVKIPGDQTGKMKVILE